MTLASNPSLHAAGAGVEAAAARASQARRWPNPELELEAEDLGGTGALAGFDSAAITAVISQQILLGGKRARRSASAEVDVALAKGDLELARLDLVHRTSQRFVAVWLAQQQLALVEELSQQARSVQETVAKRVAAGKVSPIELTRSRIQVEAAASDLGWARRRLASARADLAALWSGDPPPFARVLAPPLATPPPPPLPKLLSCLDQTAEMRQAQERMRRRQTALAEVQAAATPDLTVRFGPRHHRASGLNSWVVALSLPLPLFDRAHDQRRASQLELEMAGSEAAGARAGVAAQLAEAHGVLAASASDLEALDDQVIPDVEQIFSAVQTGYREGKFGLLEVLDAQRTLAETRQRRLDALSRYLGARITVERLIGGSLTDPASAAALARQGGQR
jgi:cobalt-zinc-cadmium efflux system outer membrane protein